MLTSFYDLFELELKYSDTVTLLMSKCMLDNNIRKLINKKQQLIHAIG